MRLLEFEQAEAGAELHQRAHVTAPVQDLVEAATARARAPRPAVSAVAAQHRVFPVRDSAGSPAANRGPIDLEKLQQRVDALEKRIKLRLENNDSESAARELEQIRQRLVKLERNLNSELWAAKQREYSLLEMLARPPLATRIGQRITRIRTRTLPAFGRWTKAAANEWWQDRKPEWWPELARAWQEALDKARTF